MQIVKVPGINSSGKTNGCERSGNAILESLNEISSSESGIPIDTQLLDLEEIHVDNFNLELTNNLIHKNALEIFFEQNKAIFLGGDHSVSFSLIKAFIDFCKNSKKEPCLIVFDAHPDCMKLIDGNFPTHEEWLRGVIDGGFSAKNILLVGVRNSEQEEIKFLKEKGIRMIGMNQLIQNLEDSCDVIMEFSNGKELYLSIDIDVIDPAFAPATSFPEIGGLSSREFIYLVQRLNKVKRLKAIDIVEINEKLDKEKFNGMTVKLGAKILGELL